MEKRINTYKLILICLLAFIFINPFTAIIIGIKVLYAILLLMANIFLLIFAYFRIKKKLLFFILFSFNILCFFAMNAEAILRYYVKTHAITNIYEIKNNDYYFNKPLLSVVLQDPEFETVYKTNEDGYRIGRIITKPDKVDWLFLGDSYTQGAQVNFEDMFTSIVADSFPSKIVLNAGISGFGLPEELKYFKKEGSRFHPKIVFLELCVLNDFIDVSEKKFSITNHLIDRSELFRFLYNNRFIKNHDELALGRDIGPFYQTEKDNIDKNILYTKTSSIKRNNLRKFSSLLKTLKEEVYKMNAELIVILIPTKEQVYKKYYSEVVTKFKIDTNFIDLNLPEKELKAMTDSLAIKYIDPLYEFKSDRNILYLSNDAHLNIQGHKKLAKIILKNKKLYKE
jgi:lysophospholipase L1-like esterase